MKTPQDKIDRVAKCFERNREWYTAYKKTLKCSICNESDPRCLDFHHRDKTTKLFNVGHYYTRSKANILKEIAKCDILCSNCHRKLTHSL